MPPLLGAIADDFTGATDLAGMLVKNGMRSAQMIGVPPHVPALHRSPKVQRLPSLHTLPVSGVTVHVEVPLHVLVLHWSLVQVTDVPPHTPFEQVSA